MKVYSINSYIDFMSKEGLLVDSFVFNKTLGIENITYDSKKAREYSLFACKGKYFKKDYLDEAVDNRISCYISETYYDTNIPVSYIIVSDIRKAMALIANIFYDDCFNEFKLVGITGTKGKSTSLYYIKYIFDEFLQRNLLKPSGFLSSIDTFDGQKSEKAVLTTPEAFELHGHFNNAARTGLDYFIMEVSSQALKYHRTYGVTFDCTVFLNISPDHISPLEHNDFEDYFSSKLSIFSQSRTAIVNLDSDFSLRILNESKKSRKIISFSIIDKKADIYGYDIKTQLGKICFRVRTDRFDEQFTINMSGLFNVENAISAIAVAYHYNIPINDIISGLEKAKVPGRMEIYCSNNNNIIAIVDYAHNKLSFEKLYESVKKEYPGREIITVFGCPGGKALNRRKELGILAGMFSDKVYLTADDPFFENVSDISNDIKQYITNDKCCCYLINDRRKAIQQAVLDAKGECVIIIAGKGSETTQKVENMLIPYESDAVCLNECLNKLYIEECI